MAYVTYVYSKRPDAVHKSNGLRKHNCLTPLTRRVFHIVLGFLLGALLAYVCGSGRSRRMCELEFKLDGDSGGGVADETAPRANWRPGRLNGDKQQRAANSKSLLFVGVMTAEKYLQSRATAVYQTWGKEVPGKIAFFSSATSTLPANSAELPLVQLRNVDDSYPPQKKSFMMLQYMWENHSNDFEWFLRADDDVYIRPDRLESFLRSINSSKPHFIGQAGRGKQEEFGLLSLEYDENFCMGGPGIIFSRETLRRVTPHVKYCLQNLYSTHEDVELGRCVQKFARIPCTWSYEMQSIFYHNFSGNSAFTGSLKTKEVHRAITLHPIKHHQHMYRVHNYMQGLKIHELQQRKIGLYRDLHLMEQLSRALPPSSYVQFLLGGPDDQHAHLFQKASLLGKPPELNKYRPWKEEDMFTWDLISRSLYSDTNLNPRRKIESHLKEGLDDVIREVMDNINLFSRERGRIIEFQQILYGYYRLNPLYGPDYVLDVLLTFKKYRGKKMTVPVRRHAYIQQQFSDLEIREATTNLHKPLAELAPQAGHTDADSSRILVPPITTNGGEHQTRINMIVPMFRKHDAFLRFMQTFERVCLQGHENVLLYIMLFLDEINDDDNQSTLNRTLSIVEELSLRYGRGRIKVMPLREKFARAKALHIGASQVDSSELVLFVDVDMVWSSQTLYRIRLNTERGKSVYFPVVFSEFDPNMSYGRNASPNNFLINDEAGYWRIFGYGIASAYKTDIQKIGGLDTSIVGWGREDVNLFEKFINGSTNVSIMRSVDPNLVHVFHVVDCDSSLDLTRLTMCRNTRSETYSSVNQLANLVYKFKENLFGFALAKHKSSNKPIR